MSDKEITIKNILERKAQIKEELEYKNSQSLNDELYEINDTLKKLGNNENNYSFSLN